jgi:hypothetical protein
MCNGTLVNKMTAHYRKFGDVKIKFVTASADADHSIKAIQLRSVIQVILLIIFFNMFFPSNVSAINALILRF